MYYHGSNLSVDNLKSIPLQMGNKTTKANDKSPGICLREVGGGGGAGEMKSSISVMYDKTLAPSLTDSFLITHSHIKK